MRQPKRRITYAASSKRSAPARSGVARLAQQISRWFMISVLALAGMLAVVMAAQSAPRWLAGAAEVASPTPTPLPHARRIGIVSGHRGHDSGTVCADGLTEAEVNLDHAVRVAGLLRAHGFEVDVLEEFDERLDGYRALALVSIHADSCVYVNDRATGFKVAGKAHAALNEEDKRLVACLTEHYARATGLGFHSNSITHDMRQYHAFRKIDPATPAAIIETGFLYLDRVLLTRHADRVAQGIVDGVLCFARPSAP